MRIGFPRLKDEDWTIISADGGRQPNKGRGKKLPLLCMEYGLTLIVLSPAVHKRKAWDKTPDDPLGLAPRSSR